MKAIKTKLSEVKLNPNNPRLIKDDNFKKLVQSIKDFPETLIWLFWAEICDLKRAKKQV
jgi:hypothetical protein